MDALSRREVIVTVLAIVQVELDILINFIKMLRKMQCTRSCLILYEKGQYKDIGQNKTYSMQKKKRSDLYAKGRTTKVFYDGDS